MPQVVIITILAPIVDSVVFVLQAQPMRRTSLLKPIRNQGPDSDYAECIHIHTYIHFLIYIYIYIHFI